MNLNLNYSAFLAALPTLVAAQVSAHLADLEGAGSDSSAVQVSAPPALTDAGKPGRRTGLREGGHGTDPNEILDLKGAAKVLGVSKAHLSKMLSGLIPGLPRIPHVRAGRSVRVRRGALLEWFHQAELESARGLTQ
jgi:excisionase family DNA binding protein